MIALFVASAWCTQAQTAERSVIGSAGNVSTVSNAIVSYTVGETFVSTQTASTLVLTQGFQQNDPVEVHIAEEELRFDATLYPNPTQQGVTLSLSAGQPVSIRLDLYDLSGRQLPVDQPEFTFVGSTTRQIDLSSFASGTYLLQMTDRSGKMNQTIQILKTD